MAVSCSSIGAQQAAAELGADAAAPSPCNRGDLRPCAAFGNGAAKQPKPALEEESSQRQPHQGRRPLSFGRWFAREARATDIIVLLAEVLLINWLHAVRLGEARHCGGGGGALGDGEGGGAAGGGSSSSSSAFPCAGGLWARLLWSLTSGAVVDPVLRLQQWDYGNLLYASTQLSLVLVALLAPALYQRCRHVLMTGVSAAALLVMHWSLWAAPAGPIPFNSATLLSAERRRIVAVYVGWKSATLFRTPASVQLVTGPLLWLLAVTALPLADRRMPPPGGGGDGGSDLGAGALRIVVHALLLFVVMAVLPYLLSRAWEARALHPAYREYVRSHGGGEPHQHPHSAAAGPGSTSGGGAGGGGGGGGVAAGGHAAAAAFGRRRRSGPAGERGGGGGDPVDTAGGDSSSSGLSSATCAPRAQCSKEVMCSDCGVASAAAPHADGPAAAAAFGINPRYGRSGAHQRTDGPSSRTPDLQPRPLPLAALAAAAAAATGLLPEAAATAAATAPDGPPPVSHGHGAVLYRPAAGRSRVAFISVKVPLGHRGSGDLVAGSSGTAAGGRELPTFQQASAAVLRSAAGAPSAHNRQQAAESSRRQTQGQAAGRFATGAAGAGGSAVAGSGSPEGAVPVRHRSSEPGAGSFGGEVGLPTFQEASAAVLRSAAAALDAHNQRACEQRWQSADAPAGPPPPLRCLSAVCVEGCVQLLMVVQFMTEAGRVGALEEEKEEQGQQCTQEGPPQLHHVAVGDDSVKACITAAARSHGSAEQAVAAAAGAAVQELLLAHVAQMAAVPTTGSPSTTSLVADDTAAAAASLSSSSPAAAAFCWPPALPLGAAAADNGHTAGSQQGIEEAVLVLVQLTAGAPARGLRSVRCVLAGPPAPEEEEAGDGGGVAGGGGGDTAAALVHMDAELPLHMLLQPPPVAAGGEVGGAEPAALAYVRLLVPPCARLGSAGLRMLHVLPPLARDTVGIADGARGAGGADGAADSTAPLAAVPLLVVGPEAAAELQQLHGQVLGPEAVAQLQQLTCTEAVAGVASASAAGSSNSSRAIAEALAEAALALQHSGLTSLVLDLGAVLQLPWTDNLGGGGADVTAAEPAAAFSELLRFLAAHRMAGCLREGLAALQRAGHRLLLPGEEEQEEPAAEAAAGVAPDDSGGKQLLHEAVDFLLLHRSDTAPAAGMMAKQQAHWAAGKQWAAALPADVVVVPPAAATPSAVPPAEAAVCPAGSAGGGKRDCSSSFAGETAMSAPSVAQPSGSLPSQLGWWLRVLACGFPRPPAPAASSDQQQAGSSSQPRQAAQQPGSSSSSGSNSPEAAYQAFKAEQCRALDCMSLILYTAFRVVTTLRTYHHMSAAAAAAAAAGGAAARGALCWSSACWARREQPPDDGGEQAAAAATGGCPHRPYLQDCCGGATSSLQLELVAQCVYLAMGLLAVLLTARTRLHARRRNAFLLLRAALDAAAFMAITLPLPRWPAPLLGVPQTWQANNRRAGVHWMVFGLYEPLTLQLSPPLQALQALIFVLPLTLLGYHSSSCRWRPALRFGLGHAVLALAVSAATDARSRMLYLRRRAHGGAGGR